MEWTKKPWRMIDRVDDLGKSCGISIWGKGQELKFYDGIVLA